MRNVTLILDDGSRFSGKSFGYEKPVAGEVVFNTAMTGYPESLTDPSYAGQLMTLTYPLVGNYGVPPFTIEPNGLATFMESEKIHAEAIIVSDYSYEYSHWNAVESLGDWLKREKVPGITGIDTRELTKVLREHGVMMGKIVFENEELRMKNEEFPSYSDINYVDQVSCKEIIHYFPSGTSSHSAANSSFFIFSSSFLASFMRHNIKHHLIRFIHGLRTYSGQITDTLIHILINNALYRSYATILHRHHSRQYGCRNSCCHF